MEQLIFWSTKLNHSSKTRIKDSLLFVSDHVIIISDGNLQGEVDYVPGWICRCRADPVDISRKQGSRLSSAGFPRPLRPRRWRRASSHRGARFLLCLPRLTHQRQCTFSYSDHIHVLAGLVLRNTKWNCIVWNVSEGDMNCAWLLSTASH